MPITSAVGIRQGSHPHRQTGRRVAVSMIAFFGIATGVLSVSLFCNLLGSRSVLRIGPYFVLGPSCQQSVSWVAIPSRNSGSEDIRAYVTTQAHQSAVVPNVDLTREPKTWSLGFLILVEPMPGSIVPTRKSPRTGAETVLPFAAEARYNAPCRRRLCPPSLAEHYWAAWLPVPWLTQHSPPPSRRSTAGPR